MQVFLTGGSGFVGRQVIHRLRQQGHTVLALARSEVSADTPAAAGAEPVRGDLGDLSTAAEPQWLTRLADVDAVVHVANLADAIALSLTRGRDRAVYYITDGQPMTVRTFFTALLDTQGVDVSGSRSVPSAVVAPVAGVMDAVARLLRARSAPPLNNWLISAMARDRLYDITAARRDLGYAPRVDFESGLRGLAASDPAQDGSISGSTVLPCSYGQDQSADAASVRRV